MKKIVLLAAMALLLSPLCASAATTGVANVTMTIPVILDISLNAGAQTVADSVTLANMQAGFKDAIAGGNITINTNNTWSLNVKAGATTFTGTGNNLKSVNALAASIDAGAYVSLNGITNVVLKAAGQAAETNGSHAMLYKFTFDHTYVPGTYIAALTYTISN